MFNSRLCVSTSHNLLSLNNTDKIFSNYLNRIFQNHKIRPIKDPLGLSTFKLFSSSNEFTTEEKNKCIERLKTFKTQKLLLSSKALQNAAVLIPLCNVSGEISLLYTLRRQDLKRHKGQVSFPGGKQDSKDLNLEITALRETEEELGIPQSSIDVWGHGNYVAGREFNILPVVGYIGEIDVNKLKPNYNEVEFAFTVPLKHFYDPQNCKYTQYRNLMGYVLPVFINGTCKIWGITALITHLFLRAFSPKRYVHELNFIRPVTSESFSDTHSQNKV